MTTNVFKAWSRECSVPLTVFAPSADEAALTFREWVNIHMPAWTKEAARMEELSDSSLFDQPQLEQAIDDARACGLHEGIMMFVDHEHGWTALPAFSPKTGSIAPPEPAVRCYDVVVEKEELEGPEVMVFAHDPEHALELYGRWHATFFGAINHRHELRDFSRWTLTGDQTILREQMDIGCTGIAGWSPVHGWSIYPADHEMAGE